MSKQIFTCEFQKEKKTRLILSVFDMKPPNLFLWLQNQQSHSTTFLFQSWSCKATPSVIDTISDLRHNE